MCPVPLTRPPNEQKPPLTPKSAVDDCRGQSLLRHPQELVAAAHDETFGSAIQGYRGDCDFTMKFKSILFAIIPATIFIATCLPRIMYLLQSTTVVGHCFLRYVKLLHEVHQVQGIIYLVVGSTVCFRHLPSIFLNGFLLVAIILDIGQTCILSLASSRSDEAAFSRLFTTTVAVKAVMLVLKSWKKSKWVRWDGNTHSPEETAGVFGLYALAWLNPLLLAGYKKRLALEDLYPLDSNLASEHLEVNHPPASTACAVALGNVTVWPER
ncbi:ABC transporter FUM19 [Metarhizium anisopliae]